jgi:membrane-bound lytic murein transglycosylase D
MSFFIKTILPLFLFLVATGPSSAQQTSDSRFSVYPIIAPKVAFWEKIFETYTENQGVMHDRNNLSITYAVVDLLPKGTPGADKINEKLLDTARQYYRRMLEGFAEGKKPVTGDERRVYALFNSKDPDVFRTASTSIRVQQGLKNRFRDGVVRSGAYMPTIKKILQGYDLPLELAYLPHVESSFNPEAGSRVGAMGLWQFTRATGQEMGMTINDMVDERFDFHVATDAAARFLRENYRQLGTWSKALTAYNYGRAGMVRAKRQWGTYPEIIANHETRIFGFAAKNFYAEFIAALRVARRLENDHTLVKDTPWATTTVRLKHPTQVQDIYNYFSISPEEFRKLNLALRRPILNGTRPIPKDFVVRLPATKRIQNLVHTMPERLSISPSTATVLQRNQANKQSGKTLRHTVKQGDTAFSIARRYKISLQNLKAANNLDSKATVRLGQSLIIPLTQPPPSNSTVILPAERVKRKP